MPTTVGYARCSTDAQDLTAQRAQLASLGVSEDRIYVDPGLSGTRRDRPGLDQALAAVRKGDTFTVTKLDRLARSVPDALGILSQLSDRGVKFALGGSVYDWDDPFARMFLTILATIAEFEGALIRQRTRDGMAIARAKGKLRGRQPKLSPTRQALLLKEHATGNSNIVELAELFEVSRPTVYRVIARSLTNASGSPAGLNDKRPSRTRRATVPGALPQTMSSTGPEEPGVLSQQDVVDPGQLLAVPDVPGVEDVDAMSLDGVREQDASKGANVPGEVGDAYDEKASDDHYEQEAWADALDRSTGTLCRVREPRGSQNGCGPYRYMRQWRRPVELTETIDLAGLLFEPSERGPEVQMPSAIIGALLGGGSTYFPAGTKPGSVWGPEAEDDPRGDEARLGVGNFEAEDDHSRLGPLDHDRVVYEGRPERSQPRRCPDCRAGRR